MARRGPNITTCILLSTTISQTKELKLNHKFYRHIVSRKAVPAVKNSQQLRDKGAGGVGRKGGVLTLLQSVSWHFRFGYLNFSSNSINLKI